MVYFSEFKGKEVCTEDGIKLGLIEDLIFLASEKPLITKLVVRTSKVETLLIPMSYVKRINNRIIIQKEYNTVELDENELYLVKNLLDKQIIDIKGNKLVRVNDVAIQDKGDFYIAGVDIGILGIMRWLNAGKIAGNISSRLGIKPTSKFLSWADIQPLELVRGNVRLKRREEKLREVRPEDLADYLERTNVNNAERFLRMLDVKKAGDVISNLNINFQASLLKRYKTETAAKLLSFIDPDDAVDILLTLTQKRREQIIDHFDTDKRKSIKHLLTLIGTEVGNLATSEILTVNPDDSAGEVINKIKKETVDYALLNNIYVVNKEDQLIGVFNLHELLLQSLDTLVYKFMVTNIIVGHLTTPREILLKRMFKYKLIAVPLVSEDRKVLGIIVINDLIKRNNL